MIIIYKQLISLYTLQILTFGENKQTKVTLADKLIVTDILVILRATWLAVPKYNGTKASHITQVVYIVNPVTTNAKLALGLRNFSIEIKANVDIMCDYYSTHYKSGQIVLECSINNKSEKATLSSWTKLICFYGYSRLCGYLKSVHVKHFVSSFL